jgi:hypothetical protein
VQDLQYVVSDGATFTDLERDATTHTVSMPDEKSPEYTVTNTATAWDAANGALVASDGQPVFGSTVASARPSRRTAPDGTPTSVARPCPRACPETPCAAARTSWA